MKYRSSGIFGETEVETDEPMGWKTTEPSGEYQRGFQAGADAARRECAEIAENEQAMWRDAALGSAMLPIKTFHGALGDVARSIKTAILSRVGQPVIVVKEQ